MTSFKQAATVSYGLLLPSTGQKTLKPEAAWFYETFVCVHQNTRRNTGQASHSASTQLKDPLFRDRLQTGPCQFVTD